MALLRNGVRAFRMLRGGFPSRGLAAISYRERGPPEKVLSIGADEEVGDLGEGEVAVKMLFAPINPSDINQIEGTYGVLPPMPCVAGSEGVGQVTAVGPGVEGLKKGDRVIPMPAAGFGTWRSVAKGLESMLQRCPSDIPAEAAATIGVNPCSAYRMLRDFVHLKEGDVVIQNGANSQVGQAVVQMARRMGVKTINVVRSRPADDRSAQIVKALGGDLVVTPAYLRTPEFRRAISDLPPPKLGLNCTAGPIAADMAAVLAPGGRLVTYGGMSLRPLVLPPEIMQDKGVVCEGFWITRWAKEHPREAREHMIRDIAEMIRVGDFKVFLERHPFSHFAHALQVSRQPFRSRKVLMDMSA